MEELKKALLALGVPQAKVEALAAENKPEDFDTSQEIKAIVADREKFFVQKNRPAIVAEYEEEVKGDRYAATVKPIINRLSRIAQDLGATNDEVNGLGAKELTDLIAAKKDEAISGAAKTGDEELKARVNEFKTKYSQTQEELKAEREARAAEVAKVEKQYADRYKAKEVDSQWMKIFQDEKFKGVKDIADLPDVVRMYANRRGYDIDLDDKNVIRPVMKEDRTAAINLEGNSTYASAVDFAVDIARANKLFPTHNGGEGGSPKLSTEQVINGKTVNVGEGANWLAKELG